MFKIVVVGIICALTSALNRPVSQDIVNKINAQKPNWQTMDPKTNPLRHLDNESARKILGTIVTGPVGMKAPAVANGIPAAFDSRTEFEGCINKIRDQA